MADEIIIETVSTEVIEVQVQGPQGPAGSAGAAGPANTLSIGTVTSGVTASATITGAAPSQTLSLVLPKGDKGDKGDPGSGGASTWDEVANKPATFPPSAHGASHALQTKAEFNGQVAGMTEDVLLRANTAGTPGNSITLTCDGENDFFSLIDVWNSSNPSNQATLVSGDGFQIPDSGEEITLSGGGAGSDPVFDQDLNTDNSVEFERLKITKGGHAQLGPRLLLNHQDGAGIGSIDFYTFSSNVETDVPSSRWLVSDTGGYTASQFFQTRESGNPGPNQLNTQLSVMATGRVGIATDDPQETLDVAGNVAMRDLENGFSATFDAADKLSANRTYALPNASGTLALTSDIPPAGGVSDGDKGDITVSGNTWTIDANAVTNAKLAQVATSTIKGRATASTGNVEDLTASQVRTILNVADGATANSADATLLNRANHTGTQTASTISDFNTAAAAAAPVQSVAGRTGTVTLAKADVGLGNVDNTSDANKPISTATQTALDGKAATSHSHVIADVTGLQTALDGKQASGSYVLTSDSRLTDSREWSAATIDQSEAEAGTATTRRAFTAQRVFQAIAAWWNASAAKTKLDGIAAGAEVNVQANWTESNSGSDAFILNKPTLAAIATSGSASDLTSGTVATARLGTGTADNTTFLRGDGSWATPAGGGGSGGTKTYAVFSAEHNQPPSTAFATLDTRNSIAVLDFSDTATESAVFVGVMPEAAILTSGLIVRLYWMGTATTGDVRWSVAFERGNTDLDADSFDTATAATATTNATSGIVTVTAITCTNIDGITAGDLFRLRVQRLGADAADTMAGAKGCELVAVEIRSAA